MMDVEIRRLLQFSQCHSPPLPRADRQRLQRGGYVQAGLGGALNRGKVLLGHFLGIVAAEAVCGAQGLSQGA